MVHGQEAGDVAERGVAAGYYSGTRHPGCSAGAQDERRFGGGPPDERRFRGGPQDDCFLFGAGGNTGEELGGFLTKVVDVERKSGRRGRAFAGAR